MKLNPQTNLTRCKAERRAFIARQTRMLAEGKRMMDAGEIPYVLLGGEHDAALWGLSNPKARRRPPC
jgi:hypothetical protein